MDRVEESDLLREVFSMRARFVSIALSTVCAALLSSTALAQNLENDTDGYFAGKLLLGFGGDAELDIEDLGGFDPETDMELSYGLGIAYMHPLHENFVLGGQLGIASWTTDAFEDADLDRNSWIDISLVPQVRIAVTEIVELYASLPLGITFDFIGEDDFAGAEIGTGFGFNFALMFGARVALDDDWGLLGELGYALHNFTHGTEILGQEGPDLEISAGQLQLNLGAYFSL
jgi:hypothetical protein